MLIIGIDPGITGAICFFEDGEIKDVIDMPTMASGNKNKKQINGSQIFNEISLRMQNYKSRNINAFTTDKEISNYIRKIKGEIDKILIMSNGNTSGLNKLIKNVVQK